MTHSFPISILEEIKIISYSKVLMQLYARTKIKTKEMFLKFVIIFVNINNIVGSVIEKII